MNSFNIKIKDAKGKVKLVRVNSDNLIGSVKANSSCNGYIWKFNGEVLKDDKTIEYYGIEEDDTIISNIPQPGGYIVNLK
jgi:hypothetical protein